MRSTSAPKDSGLARVYRSGDVSVVEFSGHITGTVVTRAVEQLETGLSGQPAAFLVIDCSGSDGYSPDVRSPGVALLKVAKRYGVHGGVCIAPSAAVRMMGAAVAFVSSLPFDFVENRMEADRAIQRRRGDAARP
jgi:hypothetical protein